MKTCMDLAILQGDAEQGNKRLIVLNYVII